MNKRDLGKPKKQVAALPIARNADGSLRVLLVTSRDTKRFVVPKGWPMKGLKDSRAAEIEAREEAGLIGRAHSKAIGSYLSWKRMETKFQLVKIRVYLLFVKQQLEDWEEKGQREMAWLSTNDAALLVDEPGLIALLHDLPKHLPKAWRTRAANTPTPFLNPADHGRQNAVRP